MVFADDQLNMKIEPVQCIMGMSAHVQKNLNRSDHLSVKNEPLKNFPL